MLPVIAMVTGSTDGPPNRGVIMSTAKFDHGRHEDNALSVVNDNPEMAKVFAILALASAVNRLAEAQEEANS